MTKFVQEGTRATNPGRVKLSDAKLRQLEPELFSKRSFKCSPFCPQNHPATEMRERLAEFLERGDSRAALVVSVEPLVVAAYSDELDAVVLLGFPSAFVERYALRAGTRLLTVNTYARYDRVDGRGLFYPADLLPGDRQMSNWSSFAPQIADFLTDDLARVEERKATIEEWEWERARQCADRRIRELGLDTARSGKPSRTVFFVKIGQKEARVVFLLLVAAIILAIAFWRIAR